MKKIIYTFMVFTVFSTLGFAQNNNTEFIWGSRLALNYSSFGGTDAVGYDVKTGAAFGIFTRLMPFGDIILQPELNYVSKGVSQMVTIQETEYDFILSYTYLEFPLLVKYNFSPDSQTTFKPEIFAGPFGALKLNSEITLEDDVTGNSIDIGDVRGFDYGIVLGAGFGVAIENIDFLFELRYTYSFPSFDKSAEQLDLNHQVFSLSLGFVVN